MFNKDQIKNYVVDDIISYFKCELLDQINEDINKLPILDNLLSIIQYMNNRYESYTLKDLDDKLFNELRNEIISVLQ